MSVMDKQAGPKPRPAIAQAQRRALVKDGVRVLIKTILMGMLLCVGAAFVSTKFIFGTIRVKSLVTLKTHCQLREEPPKVQNLSLASPLKIPPPDC